VEVVVTRKTGSYLFAFLLITAPLAAQWLNYPTSASGVRQLKPSEIKPLELAKERQESPGKDSPASHCLPAGPGPMGGLDKIVQTPALILILHEDLSYRQIFLDGRELPKDPNPAWMGYSKGRFVGDTLVVESAGYNDRTWFEFGYPHTESLRITERFRRANFGHITVDVAYSDPGAYVKPWTTKREMQCNTGQTPNCLNLCARRTRRTAFIWWGSFRRLEGRGNGAAGDP
jgi:hypothetical protein